MLWITLDYKWTKIAKMLFVCRVTGSIKSWQYNDAGVKIPWGQKRTKKKKACGTANSGLASQKIKCIHNSCATKLPQNNNENLLLACHVTMLAVQPLQWKNKHLKVQISDEEESSSSYCIRVTEVRHGQTLMSSLRTLGKTCIRTGQCLAMQ